MFVLFVVFMYFACGFMVAFPAVAYMQNLDELDDHSDAVSFAVTTVLLWPLVAFALIMVALGRFVCDSLNIEWED